MVQLAIQNTPEFALTDIEIQRSGKSYSIDTVRAIRQEYGPETALFFIIGLDAFLDLPSWKEAETLLRICHFVVISRPSTSFRAMAAIPLFQDVPTDTLTALDEHDRNELTWLSQRAGTDIPAVAPLRRVRLGDQGTAAQRRLSGKSVAHPCRILYTSRGVIQGGQ
jgi:nicotinic acid mononucleotide adenylyltransferase